MPLKTHASIVVTAAATVVVVVHLDVTSWTRQWRPYPYLSRKDNAQYFDEHKPPSPGRCRGGGKGCNRSPPKRDVTISWMGWQRQWRLWLCPRGGVSEAAETTAVPAHLSSDPRVGPADKDTTNPCPKGLREGSQAPRERLSYDTNNVISLRLKTLQARTR